MGETLQNIKFVLFWFSIDFADFLIPKETNREILNLNNRRHVRL